MPSLFRQIDVTFAGNRKEAAIAHLTVSVTKWLRVKGLSTTRLLEDVATDKGRGWSVIATENEAQAWEAAVARLGPIGASELSSEAGPVLLEMTHDARTIAQDLLANLDRKRNVFDQLQVLERSAPLGRVAEAKRLAELPGVMQLTDSQEIYRLACLVVLNGLDQDNPSDLDPLNNSTLMAQIQLVADGLLEFDRAGKLSGTRTG